MPTEEIINLALRRSLFYPTAEIYANSPSGFWEFGPIGERIRRKVVDFWRRELVEKEGFIEIFGSQILPEAVFRASGHLESFNDPIVQCKKCNSLHRADQLIASVSKGLVPESLATKELDALIKKHEVKCPKCKSNQFNEVRKFNMMMKVDIGATGNQPCYLRPETCQSIFLDFDRLYKTMRKNLPLGIAQAGASFRNEIAPRNTLLRAREFGQMELEIFFNPKKADEVEKWVEVEKYELNLMLDGSEKIQQISCSDAIAKKIISGKMIAYYLARTQKLFELLGVPLEKMRFRQLGKDEKAFYAKEAFDFEVLSSLGWIELIACNNRSDYDLKGHAKESKKALTVKEDGEEFLPHIFELSAGIDRTFFVLLDLAYRKEKRGPEERVFLDLQPKLAPYFVAVFPLVNKEGIDLKAKKLHDEIVSFGFESLFDGSGSIGKRYARVDEIGVPYAITCDFDSLKDNTVTLRERTSMKQKRVKTSDLPQTLWLLSLGKEKF
ncbi:MAG: glycine--tRNA ligase [Candidatus Diapherotrites archaeon]